MKKLGCSVGDWVVNQTATQQFRVRSLLPPQSPEGRQELGLCIKIKSQHVRRPFLSKNNKKKEKKSWKKKMSRLYVNINILPVLLCTTF
jgi:hypothetical protein